MSTFALPAAVDDTAFVRATYLVSGSSDDRILEVADRFAIGQTIGTWLEVPGTTDELTRDFAGRVLGVQAVPASDAATRDEAAVGHLVTLALPVRSFGAQFPMMFTTLLGNDASTSVSARLVELELPRALEAAFGGPRFGIEGVRALTGVHNRPLLLNMVKPCVGLTPEQGAPIVEATAAGGVDLIKDDELMGSPDYSPVGDRVRAYTAAIERSGGQAVYVPNVTDRPVRMMENARIAVGEGARALMVNYAAVGYGAVQDLAEVAGVPLLGHLATAAIAFEGPRSGYSAHLAWGVFPRLAGIDLAVITTAAGGYPVSDLASTRAAQQLVLPHPDLKPSMPIIGGGVHPGAIAAYVARFGRDIVLGVGGAIQGHPGGAAAGAIAVRAAIDAAVTGESVTAAATRAPHLARALELWGAS